jgi:hypothetical protein
LNTAEQIAFADDIVRAVNADGGMEGPFYNFSGGGYSWDEWFEQRGLKNESAFGDFFLLSGYIANNVPFKNEMDDPEFTWIMAIQYNKTQRTYGNKMLIWNNTWNQDTTIPWRLSDMKNTVIEITAHPRGKLSATSAWSQPIKGELRNTEWQREELPWKLGFVTTEVLEKMFLNTEDSELWELWMSGGLLNWRNFPYELTVKPHPVYSGVWQGICPEHGNESLWSGWTHDNYGSRYQNQIKELIQDGSIYAIEAPENTAAGWEYIICRRCRDDQSDTSLATLEDLFA